jgi:hypothetical protein
MYFSHTLAFFVQVFLSSIHMLLMHVFHVHLLFCASIFYRQYTCSLCMYFMYTCFFVQVFFIVNTHASYACISCTLAFLCKYFLSSIHMLLTHVFHVLRFLHLSFQDRYMDDDNLYLNIFYLKIGLKRWCLPSFFYFVNILNGSDYNEFEQLMKRNFK